MAQSEQPVHGEVPTEAALQLANHDGTHDQASMSVPDGCIDQSIMQASFDRIVSQEFKTSFRYLNVSVLIIHWAAYLDPHQNCGPEVIELNDVFEQKYRFNSQILTLGDKRHPQLQLDRGITNFVFDNDGPCRTNLLIVYYTGHGTHSSEKGLDIAGTRHPEQSRIAPNYLATANWNQAEQSLRLAEADVLTILDTCNAGSVMTDLGAGDDHQLFEVLAASGSRSVTDGPGSESFTRALIDSLLQQLHEDGDAAISTFDLNQTMKRRLRHQNSHLLRRYKTRGNRFIELAPLGPGNGVNVTNDAGGCSHLTLRLVLDTPTTSPSETTNRLVASLSRAAVESKTGARGMELVSFNSARNVELVNFRAIRSGQRLAQFAALLRAVIRCQRHWRQRARKTTPKRPRIETEDVDCNEFPFERPCKVVKLGPLRRSGPLEMLTPPPSSRSCTSSPF